MFALVQASFAIYVQLFRWFQVSLSTTFNYASSHNQYIKHQHIKHTAKVNVRTGTPGWYKRINRNYNSVSRSCRLTDEVELDPSRKCVDRMQAAARAAVLTRKVSWSNVLII